MDIIPHYYGDIVRKIFLICALIMLFTLPFIKGNLTSPIFYSILTILVLTFFAGMTNPKQKTVVISDVIVSVLSFGVFTYQAVTRFEGFLTLFFITNLVLALLSLLAFYWSIKTIRWIKSPLKIPIENIPAKFRDKFMDKFQTTPGKTKGPSEDTPPAAKAELTDEERRKKRFLGSEE